MKPHSLGRCFHLSEQRVTPPRGSLYELAEPDAAQETPRGNAGISLIKKQVEAAQTNSDQVVQCSITQ